MTIKPNCPISKASQTLGKKWNLQIIYYLRERKRFCELQEVVGGVNPATLSSRLRGLEKAQIIRRHEFPGVPRHVEYELTEKGNELIPLMYALSDWVHKWQHEVE